MKKGQRIALSAILCVFVALCAVLALVFGTPKTYVPAEEKDNVTVTHTDHTGWTALDSGTLSEGNYYLESDIWRGPNGLTVTGDATLCLNGHSLACGTSDSTYSFSVITVTNGATLTICDCDSTTQHTVGDKTYSGGVITGGRCREYGGGVYVENGTLILDGGTIAGNTANYGGGVYVSGKGSFIMNGGMIAGNTAATTSTFAYGGGVYLNGGTFTMNGGTISGNTAQYEGANMYVNAGTVNITGGYFNGGISNGGTIRVSGGYFSESAYNFLKNDFTDSMIVMDISKLGGSAFDDDYVEGYPYAAYRNAVVNNEKSIFYDGSPIKEGEDFFVEGVDGVTLTYQYKTSGGEYVDGLPADIGHYTIKVTGQDIPNKIYCDVEFTLSIYEKVVASVTFNGDTVSCGSMTDAFENASRPDTSADNRAVITLWNNVDMDSAIAVTSGQYITLDLNGCKITVTLAGNTPFNVNGGDLVLKDSNAETQYLYYKDSNGKYVFDNGTDEWDTAYGDASAENKGVVNGGVITGGNVSGNAGAFNVYGGGKFTMNGGTIAGNAASYGGGVYLSSNSSFTMNGGMIAGNTANNGGGVCSRYTGSSFIMNGGTIADNTASSGSCVYVGENSSFKMTDGYLDGSFYKGSSVTFSGGYFTESTYNSLNNDFRDDTIVIDISKLGGSAFDSDYVEGYPYALYKNVVVTIETNLFYDGAPIKEGEDFFVEGADGVALTYQYKTSGGDYINGLPTDVGIYTIKVTGQDIPNKIYCEKEFVISIHGEALLTVTFDGVTYDCVTVSYAFDLAKGFATTAENRAVIILWADVECDSTHKVESGQYITLDLNGYMFTKTNSGALLDIVGDFILMDSNPVTEHRYYADSNRKYVLDNGTESWQSAYNSASTKGTLYGGVVTGGNNGSGNGGFNVYGGGKFTMKSGVIAGNYASNGGGVYVGSDSSFIMEGGMITGNRAYSYNGGRGGGVCVRYSGGSFTMIGGSIISNTSKNGNGVYVSDKAEVIMEGGYFGGDIENNGGTVSISGGYFSEEPLNIALGYSAQDISSLGTSFDADYREGFPYAVYQNGTVSITANGNSVYDDFPVEEGVDFTVSGADGVTLSYSYKTGDGIDYVEGLPADAGVYTVKATGFDSTQKIWYETEFALTIQQAAASVPAAPTFEGLFIYGQALNEHELSEGWAWVNGETVPEFSLSAESYEVTIAVDDKNYDWSGVSGYADGYYTTTIAVLIHAKNVMVIITPNGGVYGSATGATAVLNGLVGTDDPAITLTYTGENYDSTTVPTDAGTYTVTATIADEKYNLIGTTTAEFVIGKATVARPTEDTDSFTYTGSELTYVPEGYDEATMSITGDKQTNANESGYTVTVTLKDAANYQWTDGGDDAVTFTWIVGKAEPNYTAPTGLSAMYGDTLASVTLSDGWTWDDDSQSVGNAGERTFSATFTPDDTANYQTVGLELTVMVAKATPSVTVTAQADGTLYTSGSLYDVAISANAGGVAGSVAWDAGQDLLAGSNNYSWTFTPDDTENYEIVIGFTELTVEAVTETGITVGKQPTKTEYTALETFVADGMEIELNFNDGSSRVISGYTLSIDGQSDLVLNYAAGGKVTVKVSYGGFEASIELTVTQIIVEVPVAAEDLVYNGIEQIGVAEGEHYSVLGGTAINAGDHEATLTLESDNYAWSDASFDGTITWSIAKATVQVPEVSDKIYTGGKLSSGLIETEDYVIVSDDGGTENGQYSVMLELKDSANCMWSSSDESTVTIYYNIVRAQNAWTTEISIDGWTFGENENAPVFAAKFGNDTAIAEYKAAGADDSAYVTEVPTAAGIYVLRVTIAGTGNYTELVDTYEFTIEKATAIAPASPTVTGTLTYGEALAGLTLSGDWTWVNGETVPAVSDSGVTGYEVTIAVDDQNYDWSGVTGYANGYYTTTVTVTVNAKEIIVSITPNGGVYGSVTGASAVLNGLVGEDDPVITLTYTGEGYDSTAVPTDAGTYTVTATIADNNYNLIGTTTAEFTIEKATAARPTENTDSFTYTGSELTYVPEGYDEATMNIAGNVQTNANESGYTVTITLKDAANYQWTDGGDDAVTFTWIVKKAIVTVPEAAEELIYNGIEQIGVAAGEHYSVAGGSAINAGEYEATLTLESDNYVWSDASFDGTIAWSIAKAEPNVSLPTDLTVCVDHILADVKLAEGWTWADDSVSVGGAGVYSFAAIFTPDDTDNYLIVTAELTVTINEHTGGMASCTHRAVCEVCGTEYGGFVSHVYNRQVVTDRYLATAATCTAPATYYYSCGCGAKGTATFVYGEALGHTAGEAVRENEIAATCTEDGSYDEVIYCTVCGEELSRNAVIVDALGHTAGEAVRENEIAATCTEDGSYDEVIYCAVCGEELSRNTVIVEAFGHLDEDKDGSCESCGGAMSELQVTITISGGTIEGMQDSSILIDKDTQITVIADVAEEGKEFKGWSIDGGKTIVSEDAIYTFIADESIALTAVYEDVASEGLSTGAIVGITLGSIAGLLLLAYVIGAVLYKKEILLGEFFAKIYPFIEK